MYQWTSSRVRVEVVPGADVSVSMGPGELDRLLANLVGNALRHTDGGVEVTGTAGEYQGQTQLTATSIEQMILWRAIQGFLGAGMIPTVFASAYTVFPRSKFYIVGPIIGGVGIKNGSVASTR